MIASPVYVLPRVSAESSGEASSYRTTVDLGSGWSAYPVTFDGKITNEQEWSDAYQQKVVFFRGWLPDEPHLRTNDTAAATFYVKNDAKWLYLLVHVNSTNKDPQGIGISYYWWTWHGVWDGGRAAGVERDGSVYDAYYVNETYWKDVKPTNVKGAVSCVTFLLSGSDCWFEFAKMLRSDDAHDWSFAPGEEVGTGPPDLLVNMHFAKNEGSYIRYTKLHLSPESEASYSELKSSFTWRSGQVLTLNGFLLSPDFSINVEKGTYRVGKIAINATFRESLNQSRKPDYSRFPTFDIGTTVGSRPESFSCQRYCGQSSNPYYGVAVGPAPNAIGDQSVRVTMDFTQIRFSVQSSNGSKFPTMILFAEPIFRYDPIFASDGKIFINLVVWSGDPDIQTWNLMLQNATLDVELVGEGRLLASLPRPSFHESWTWNVSRRGLRTPIAGLAASDDGHVLAAANVYNDTSNAAEVYLLDSEGHLVWSNIHPGGQFYWNHLDIGLTPDRNFAAYAIYSSGPYQQNDAGIWYVDENGHPIWVHRELGYHSVAMSSDGQLVAAVGATKGTGSSIQSDGKLLVLDGAGRVLWGQHFPREMPMKVSVSPDGHYVAVTTGVDYSPFPGGTNSSVYLFDRSGQVLWRHVGPGIARSTSLSQEAKKIIVSYIDGTVEILDRSGTVIEKYLHSYRWPWGGGGDTWSVAMTPDGSQLLTSQDWGLFIFTNTLSQLIAVPGWGYGVISVAESSGGQFITAGTFQGVLHSYILSSDNSVQYALLVSKAAQDVGVTIANSTLNAMILAQSQGRWLDAYWQSQELVNATIAGLRSQYSKSYTLAHADMLAAGKMFNETSSRLNEIKSRLNSTQASKALTMLSEASGLLIEAESYLAKAPGEFRSGNYVIALKFVQRAAHAIEEVRSRINNLSTLINESASIVGVSWEFVATSTIIVIAVASSAIWLIRRRRTSSKA